MKKLLLLFSSIIVYVIAKIIIFIFTLGQDKSNV